MWQRGGGGVNLSRFLRSGGQSTKFARTPPSYSPTGPSSLPKGVGTRENDDGRTRWRRQMSCEGCLVRSDAENRFEACIVCTMLSTRRATCDFDSATM